MYTYAEGVAQNRNIIMHLLSQVRIGMDLSRVCELSVFTNVVSFHWSLMMQVTLPTFILEKRSLLEMYADFFAHPDLFVK